MGTTSKGLRYPEGTVLGNTLHTRIKELADDTNTQLVSRDARFDGLDTKTNATNADLALRGMPISRHGGSLAAATNMPNDSAVRTIWTIPGVATVPGNARTAMVSVAAAAQCVTNAQVWWQPYFSPNSGGVYEPFFPNVSYANVHNTANTSLNMGFAVSSVFNVLDYRGQSCYLTINGHNDTGSGAWIHAGYLQWSILFMS